MCIRDRFNSPDFKLNQASSEVDRFVDTSVLPFKIDYSLGSLEMLDFSFAYANSKSEKLIQSDFKYLTINRWNQLLPFHFITQFIYWILATLFILHVVYYKDKIGLKIATLSFIGVLLIWEIIQFISYSLINVSG